MPASLNTQREVLVLVDDRFNSTTAPTHTGGDFWMYGGITRDVILHVKPAAYYLQRVSGVCGCVGRVKLNCCILPRWRPSPKA